MVASAHTVGIDDGLLNLPLFAKDVANLFASEIELDSLKQR